MERLYEAAVEGDVDSLLGLLEDDPLILDKCIMWSYNGSPLHIAALLGHERFVDEILDRKPKLAGELDSQEISPLHFATAKGHLGVVKKLLTINADMCYARDVHGRNPLHIAVVKGRVDVLKELVQESPRAARQKMGHGETILHLCVKHNKLEALKVLVESVGDHEFVNLKDDDGNTILHLAAAYKQTETISFLMSCTTAEVNSLNVDGLMAHDLLARSGKSRRHMDSMQNFCEAGGSTEIVRALSGSEMEPMTMGALPPDANDQNIASPMQRKGRKKNRNKQYDWLERKKNALMLVASLIATMAFKVGIHPPGGFWRDTTHGDSSTKPHTAGYSIMADDDVVNYLSFWSINTVAFLASLSIVLIVGSGFPLRRRFLMWILVMIMGIAIISIALTYAHALRVFMLFHQKYMLSRIEFEMIMGFGVMMLLLLGLGSMICQMLK